MVISDVGALITRPMFSFFEIVGSVPFCSGEIAKTATAIITTAIPAPIPPIALPFNDVGS